MLAYFLKYQFGVETVVSYMVSSGFLSLR